MIQISDVTISAAVPSPSYSESRAGYRLESSGDINKNENSVQTDIGDWINPKTGMSNYECRFTHLSGSNPSFGTMNTWLDLALGRDFGLVDSSVSGGILSSTVRVEIRDKATQTIQDSCVVSLVAYLSH